MSKNINEGDLKQNCLVDRIASFLNKRVVLIGLFIAISFSYPVASEVSTLSLVTDSSWKCLDAEVDGWTSVDFDDSYWENGKVLDDTEAVGFPPECFRGKVIWYPESPIRHTSYFRKNIVIDGKVISGKISIGDDGNTDWYVYVNSEFVGKSGYWSGVSEFDIGSYLKPGKNVIAVRAQWNRWGCPYWGLIGTIRVAPVSTLTPSPSPTSTPTPTIIPISSPTPGERPSPSPPSMTPFVTPNGGIGTEAKSIIIAIIVATIGGVLARVIWSHIKKGREY
jgi:hypothetical protein